MSHSLDQPAVSQSSDTKEPNRARRGGKHHPAIALAIALTSAFLINLDSSIVNVALPSMSVDLHASTSSLQWFVDAYNLALAALVLAGGNLGDRFGRRGTLVAGHAIFVLGSITAILSSSSGELIASRLVMGAGAALIFPMTLSIITDTFPDSKKRSKAIGGWAAATGIGFATGPLVGGALLEYYWWGVIFAALIPVALAAMLGAIVFIPRSHPATAKRMDPAGLLLSILTLGTLVYTVIEAPNHGWLSPHSLIGYVLTVAFGAIFVWMEHSSDHPMIDVALFGNPRFTAASGSITVAYFALFGFSFLVTQYFQGVREYSPLETGVRVLPIAVAVAVFSGIGAKLALTVGTKLVVTTGLLLLAVAFGWIAFAEPGTSYLIVAAEMILLGAGLGLTSAPATDAVMGAVRPEQAGAGSAVNDATRELGGTLGVAVLGSIFASLYVSKLNSGGLLDRLPEQIRGDVGESYSAGRQVVEGYGLTPQGSSQRVPLVADLNSAFMSGLHGASWTAMAVCLVGAAAALLLLPSAPPLAQVAGSKPKTAVSTS